MTKRLFIFAAYDKDSIVDETLLHYLNALSSLGDIIFTMDNDVSDAELGKVKNIPNIIHATAVRHGEYDFGSYKRGYLYACEKGLLNKYDWIYLVNDSVYGPLWDITPILTELESRNADLTGLINLEGDDSPLHVQSWFVGLRQNLATADFFANFMASVRAQNSKAAIVFNYEYRLSYLIMMHGYRMSTMFNGRTGDVRHMIYDAPVMAIKLGIPFIKKAAMNKIPYADFLSPYADVGLINQIMDNYSRTGSVIFDKQRYKKFFRITVFSIPIITLYHYVEPQSRSIQYKLKLFDFIPVFKITK